MRNSFEYFVFYLQAPIVFFIGLLGNSLGLFILRRKKKFKKIGPREMYLLLFVFDSAFLATILNYYLIKAFDINLLIKSNLACKLFMYLIHVVAPVSAMILVYILVERFLSIKYPVESNLLRKKNTQLGYLLINVVFNMIYYLVVPFSYDVISYEYTGSNSNRTLDVGCYFSNAAKKRIVSNLVLAHKILLPLSLMIIFSSLLVHSIFKSRSRVLTLYSRREISIFHKDVQLSIMSILLNLIFASLNVPFALVLYFYQDYSDLLFLFTLNVFYLSYAFNFYLFFMFNSMFRDEFISTFKSEASSNNSPYESVNLRIEKQSFY